MGAAVSETLSLGSERHHEEFARIMGIGRTQEESWTKAAPSTGHVYKYAKRACTL